MAVLLIDERDNPRSAARLADDLRLKTTATVKATCNVTPASRTPSYSPIGARVKRPSRVSGAFGTELVVNNAPFDDPWANTPGGNPFPLVANANTTFPPYGGFVSFPFDMKPPYSDQWNVSLQRQLGAAWMVSAVRLN